MANRTTKRGAEYARRRAERAKLLAGAEIERAKARDIRAKGGAMATPKALDCIARAKELEAQAYDIRLRNRATGGPSRRKGKSKNPIVRALVRLGGGE